MSSVGSRAIGRSVFAALLFSTAFCLQAATAYKQSSFHEAIAFSGLVNPTAVRFLPDGRVLVAEKSGLVKMYDSLTDTTPTVVADLRTKVHNFWDRGLLGLAVPPGFDPASPDLWRRYIYVLYTHDAAIGGAAPRWGAPNQDSDGCPTPPGATTDGCVVSGRLSRLLATGADWSGSEQVLIEDWCQQFPSHSIGSLSFGADEKLYVSGGDGASFNNTDWGQYGGTSGTPPPILKNPCGDPPVPAGGNQTLPGAEGGALRAQSPQRTTGEPFTLNGSILRVDPSTGAGVVGNPLFGSSDANARRLIGYGLRNPFRTIVRPGTNDVWIGDVGWDTWEEIDRLPDLSSLRNFGWPCYEGDGHQSGYEGTNPQLTICKNLYQANAVTPPVYTYNHSASVVAGDGCTTGSSSISGMAFYQGGSNYPPNYNGALFFADYSRKCMWVMFPGGNGDPDPNTRVAFAAQAQGPVELQIGPDGSLYYADFDGGHIMRVDYGPVAVASGSPTTGNAPLTVNFSSTGSMPAQTGDTITYAWDLDGDGQYDDSTATSPSFLYTANGSYTARLKVTDNHGASNVSNPITISVGNTAPTATILTPSPSLTWKVGDPISFSGSATDPEQGPLPASALSWQIIIHHCPSNCHTHQYQTFTGVAGGSFPAPDHEYPSYLEIQLTATDSGGLTNTVSVNVNPQTVDLNFATVPTGLQLAVGTSTSTAPFTRTVIIGSLNTLSAPSPQGTNNFSTWSDGGAATHSITAPPTTPATFTATYTTGAGSLPPPWQQQTIGAVLTGSASAAGGIFTVTASGWDIWSSSDEFHYVYQPLSNAVTVIARVSSVQNNNPWAKAGVMIRETLAADSRMAMVSLTPANGIVFQRRTAPHAEATSTGQALVAAPYWVKLTRSANTFSAYSSPDGIAWNLIGTASITMAANVYAGLSLTAHDDTAFNTSTFDNVSVSGATNAPPTANITAPANGALFTAPAAITINATAADSDGTVSKVDFYQGATLLGTDTTSPYSFAWSNVAAGTYSLTAVATDNLGTTGTSTPVSVTVNAKPTAAITAPAGGATFTAPASITINATAADSDGTVTKVDFYQGATLLGTDATSPYSFAWTSVPAGSYSLTAVATDNRGATGTSAPVNVTVNPAGNTPPTAVITAPANGALFTAPASITINATAADSDGTVSKVDFYQGATLLGTDVSNPYAFTWTNVAAGTYSLTAVATDNGGGVGTSAPVSVTVNARPTTLITAPANGATFTAPASITINATAADADGTVSKVDFYQGATLIGTDTTSPYSFAWNGVAAGSYTLTTVATDNRGATGTSAPVGVTVTGGGGGGLPAPWVEADIGPPLIPGSSSFSGGTFTVNGEGWDIWSNGDEFHYVYQPLTGDGTLTARIASEQNTDPWAKVGVMIRESLAPNAKHAMMVLTPGNGLAFQRRITTGAESATTAGGAGTAPYWVRIQRSGSTFRGYRSTNGTTWTQVGSVTITMNANTLMGLVVSSHNESAVCTATMDTVTATSP